MFEGVESEDSPEFGDHLVTTSCKMIFLDKLVEEVRAQGDQMIIFSNFTALNGGDITSSVTIYTRVLEDQKTEDEP